MNKVFLSGNLSRDPEVRYTQKGTAYARVGIAVNRPYSKDKEKATDFFTVVAWDKTAEFCGNYLKKGTRVVLEGRLQPNSYENKDGVKVNTIEIIADNFEFAGSKRSEGGDEDYSDRRSSSNSSYADNFASRREQKAPPRRNNNYDDFGGEPIDPEDTPF